MFYGIDCGHNAPPDTGAVGWDKEDRLTRAVGNGVIAQLKALGHQVIDCTPKSASSVNNSLSQRVQTANNHKVDRYVAIHFNAFNKSAHGTEVFAASSNGNAIALSVLNEIVKLGFTNRGVKDGSHLYVVRNTDAPAILIECCFIDSETDKKLYNTDKMVNAIIKGLTGVNAITGVIPPKPDNSKDKWHQFIHVLRRTNIQYPQLKQVQLAQAILESARGTSDLFKKYSNPYGMKYRNEMSEVATKVFYAAHDGEDSYCCFNSFKDAVQGYWVFINRPPYAGWERFGDNPEGYVLHLVKSGYAQDPKYLGKILDLLDEAREILKG